MLKSATSSPYALFKETTKRNYKIMHELGHIKNRDIEKQQKETTRS